MRRYLALSLSILMVLPGCASYTVRAVPIPKTVLMPFSRIDNSVMVAVDPYIQPGRQKEVFNDELKGVLPLYILVENRGDRELSLHRSAIALELPDGRQISPVKSATVAGRLAREPSRVSPSDEVQGAVMLVLLFPLIPLAVAAIDAQKKTQEARVVDYLNKEFQDVVLTKDASAHGFVYFMPPSGTRWSTKARLVLRFVDKTDGTSFVIRVPVSESAFKEGPIDTKKQEPIHDRRSIQ